MISSIKKRSRSYWVSYLFVGVFLLGCSSNRDQVEVPVEPPEEFSQSGTQVIPEEWWTEFNDPKLDALIDSALGNNFSLRSSWEQLQAARAVVDRESSLFWPQIEGSARSAINRPEPDFVGGENTQLGLSADYEIDLWGRISSQVEAERYRLGATYADYQTAAISLSAEITQTWFRLLAARQRLEIINSQVETNDQILGLIRSRFGSGQIRAVDILRQQQLIEATEEQRVIAKTNVETLENQLQVLLGRNPTGSLDTTFNELPELPPLPQTGVPLELVRRRPDVQSAFNLVHAADQEYASAISAQYPRLSLSASGQLRANDVDNLFENWAYSIVGNILAPIFYGGRLSAEVDRTEAVKNQLLYDYGQTVLVAFREVEDALVREQQQKERIEVLEEQVRLADQSYKQLRLSYFNGISNYLDVLTALTEFQQLRRDLITARQNLLEFRIALYRSLAGGFETPPETAENQTE